MYWSEEEQRVPHLNMNIKSKFDLMQKPASRGQSLSGETGRGMAQYANTWGLNNYNYVDGQHLCVLLKCFPGLKSKIFLSRYSSRMSTCSDPDRPDTDDENSQRSYSNASSPSGSLQQTPNYVS